MKGARVFGVRAAVIVKKCGGILGLNDAACAERLHFHAWHGVFLHFLMILGGHAGHGLVLAMVSRRRGAGGTTAQAHECEEQKGKMDVSCHGVCVVWVLLKPA